MSRIKLKYVDSFVDRYGVRRFYFRRAKGDKRVLLPGLPGSDAFMSAYQLALDGRPPAAQDAPRTEATPVREVVPFSFDALVARYFASPDTSA